MSHSQVATTVVSSSRDGVACPNRRLLNRNVDMPALLWFERQNQSIAEYSSALMITSSEV